MNYQIQNVERVDLEVQERNNEDLALEILSVCDSLGSALYNMNESDRFQDVIMSNLMIEYKDRIVYLAEQIIDGED